MNEYVGIDIGGTKIEAVLVDERNTVLNTCRIPARPGAQNVLDDVIGITRRLGGEPVAVGVGLPGQVDSVTGVVRDIVNLDIVKLELGREASKALGIPVQVENDVNAAALGAVALIDDQVSAGDTVVFLNFGTGLAAGVVRDGHVERGYSGSYGEIGHIPVDPNKFLCNCGQRGCLETVTSGGSVAKLWPGQPPLPDLIEKTKAGEPRAMEVYGIVQHGLADTIQVVGQAYDPKRHDRRGDAPPRGDQPFHHVAASARASAPGAGRAADRCDRRRARRPARLIRSRRFRHDGRLPCAPSHGRRPLA